jgi:hypothetical protein
MSEVQNASCGICKSGILVPVNLGTGPERILKYRCSNPQCNARFDEHGYEVFEPATQTWKRLSEG